MKYGLINYQKKPPGRNSTRQGDTGLFNIGDNIQIIATKRFYIEELYIPEEDIIEIDFHDLGTYRREYVIVLINLFFFGCHDLKETWFPASPYIIPVFIGVHFSTRNLTDREAAYLRSFSPIGCRDEFTLGTMRKYNIPAFLFGCVTATFPMRKQNENRNTVFLVDVDENEIAKRLPAEFKEKRIEVVHHVISGTFSETIYQKADSRAEELLKKYRDEAALVVTSRLHCASPCIAMGIPTIMIVKEKEQRISWLSKLINIYTEDEYDIIDWNVKTVNYENTKNRMIQFIKDRIHETQSQYKNITAISAFFETDVSDGFLEPFHHFFRQIDNMLEEGTIGYYLWGGTALAEEAYHYISSRRPACECLGLIDEYNEIWFNGTKSITFDDFSNRDKRVAIIVTPTSSIDYIKNKLKDSQNMGMAIFSDGTRIEMTA